ncbi:MAG: hypothetical protein KUG65_02750 [Sphingomonadaceae bacterium]|nr:hypothetical protein [Sphingomonadaceae bacterium]
MSDSTGNLRTVWLASAAAVLPIAAVNVAAEPVEAVQPAKFAPPSEPMILKRILRRPLPGGAEVMTLRSYEIQIRREGAGYLIDGKLIDVRTEVPGPFEALAAIERQRSDDGMFPMKLDDDGRFVPSPAKTAEASAQAAGQQADAMVSSLGLSASEARDARKFIGQVSAKPARTDWPKDLFSPTAGKRTDTHTIPLPGGKTGHVSVEIDASVQGDFGLLTSLKRHVTTKLGDSTRVTQETWTLSRKS